MNLKNQRPIWVPEEHFAEIASLSKAALMDMVWDLLSRPYADSPESHQHIMKEFRDLAEAVSVSRRRARKEAA